MRNDPDMPRPDTGNFNKLLTSLGLLLLGAALVIPYFYFSNTDTLSIPADDLGAMTKTGRQALRNRQDAIAALEPWVVVLAVVLAILGVILLLFGALRLYAAQQMEDEESDLRRKRARLEVEEMSPAEQERTKVEKAKAEVAEEGGAGMSDSTSAAPASRADWRTDWSSRVAVISRISDRVSDALRNLEAPLYEFKWQVRIGARGDEIRLDGLFESKMFERPDVVFSNRLLANPGTAQKNARNLANDMIALLARYEALTRRPAKGWIVNVLPEEAHIDPDADLSKIVEPLRRAFVGFGSVTVIRETDLASLPTVFKQEFRAA